MEERRHKPGSPDYESTTLNHYTTRACLILPFSEMWTCLGWGGDFFNVEEEEEEEFGFDIPLYHYLKESQSG